MSGHSKWATTKHKKAAIDAKRGKLFAKLIKNIEIAARLGGGDPDGNPTLYDAIVKAKKASMPADNIKRAVKRGSGEEAGGANYEEIVYEGYAPAGVGLIIECLTDNRNRAAADVRSTLTKGNGSLATSGSVSFNFERKGLIEVPSEGVDYDKLFEVAAEAGAEDVADDGDVYSVYTDSSDLVTVRKALQDAGFDYDSADIIMHPNNEVELSFEDAQKVSRLIDNLDDLDDVQNIYSNWTASDEVMAQLEEAEQFPMMILGVDPGLTRCGVGVIEAGVSRRLSFIHVDVLRSEPYLSQDLRLLKIYNGLVEKIERFSPDVVSVERVFAQENRNTVLGTAQVAGLAMLAAAQRNIPVALHTPTEVKLAVAGNGKADKAQVERMVARLLALNILPTPADAADALAQAICHALRPEGALQGGEREQHLTSAQKQWALAQRAAHSKSSVSRGMQDIYRTDVLLVCILFDSFSNSLKLSIKYLHQILITNQKGQR